MDRREYNVSYMKAYVEIRIIWNRMGGVVFSLRGYSSLLRRKVKMNTNTEMKGECIWGERAIMNC